MGKTCFFIGHSDSPETIYPRLLAEIECHISKYQVAEFLVGKYGAFDHLAARAVAEAKKRHPDISLLLALAYYPDNNSVNWPDYIDDLWFPFGQESLPHKVAIPRLNQRIVKESDYVIAYVTNSLGGAYKTLQYAKAREKKGLLQTINLADG